MQLAALWTAMIVTSTSGNLAAPPQEPKQLKVGEAMGRLLNAEEEDTRCSTDSDCHQGQYCSNDGLCLDDIICYGDDECRGRQICDLERYVCVNPTPSPVAPPEPGCCRGASYRAQAKCVKLEDEIGCERKECEWVVTDDRSDCIMTTTSTTTTTKGPGCCTSDEWRAADKCLVSEDEAHCERMAKCYWIETEDMNDCVLASTTATPGCCTANDYKSNDECSASSEQTQCERMSQCQWIETEDPNECLMTTTEPGCCSGDSAKNNEKCNAKQSEMSCQRWSSCHWVYGEHADCKWTATTTITPGCCYRFGVHP